ncbi:hypothetical protein ACIHCQ_25655 [Streptomyces sp. NPDC052236]|uniref:hypothetical protein n=1 Tax=Streptomyces sp. NPDC052236 TaxID=3365686 RepID=UPI0037D85C75
MHADIHLQLHELRAAELRREAAEIRSLRAARAPRGDLRTQLGWTLVELGLHLIRQPPPRAAPTA